MNRNYKILQTAYGTAENIPALIQTASQYPICKNYNDEPYFTLWSSLWHQGDIYSASVAVVPELLSISSKAPENRIFNSYHLAVSICITDKLEGGDKYTDLHDDEFNKSLKLIAPLGLKIIEYGNDIGIKRIGMAGIAFSVDDLQLANFLINADTKMTCQNCDHVL